MVKPVKQRQIDVVRGWLWLGGSGACVGICAWIVANFDPWPAVIPVLVLAVGALFAFAAALGTWAHER